MTWLSRIIGRPAGEAADPPSTFDAALAPGERLVVIGDIHGSDDLLARLLDRIAALDPPPDRLVFVGDYVDRGENSAKTLARLHLLGRHLGDVAVFLRGNHEEMLLEFLDTPAEAAASWLRYGGLQTLASFGIAGASQTMKSDTARGIRDALADALGADRIAWLESMPSQYTSGNVTVVHAAADPALPMDRQPHGALTWGHRDFLRQPRSDGQWIVHGHTVVDAVTAAEGRIAVDTGAFATGRLSAAVIDSGRLTPLTVAK